MESYRNLGVLIANRFVHSSPSDSQTYVFRHIGYISPRVGAREHGWVHATFLTAVDPIEGRCYLGNQMQQQPQGPRLWKEQVAGK
jgi:hypothetical protein